MKFFRIILVIFAFFLIPFAVSDGDWIGTSIWFMIFISNLIFLATDEIKKHIDEKHEELLKELKNKSDE